MYVKQLQSLKADQYTHLAKLHNKSIHTTNNGSHVVFDLAMLSGWSPPTESFWNGDQSDVGPYFTHIAIIA